MKGFMTKYGRLKGISNIEFYTDGVIKECKLSEFCEIKTEYGVFVPQYDEEEVRHKYKRSLSFYESGDLKSISFQNGTKIVTSIGELSAELAIFHENGQIKRIFPLNGKITGYWTEENEYELSQELDFHFEFGSFRKKIIGINFYESGAVKSVTLWPKDFINILSPYGMIETRIGFSLYENGAIKSCEPRRQTLINTVIGELHAFNYDAIGLNADTNSLNFKENGTVKSLYTSLDKITIKDSLGNSYIYEPSLKANNFNDKIMDVVPLRIEFCLGKVKINETEYNIYDNTFCVDKFVRKFK